MILGKSVLPVTITGRPDFSSYLTYTTHDSQLYLLLSSNHYHTHKHSLILSNSISQNDHWYCENFHMSSNFFSVFYICFFTRFFLNSCQRMAGSIEMTIILKLCGTERICLLHVEVLNKAIKERHYSRISIIQSAIYIFNIPRVFFAMKKNVPVS